MSDILNATRLDANESLWFGRQLEYVKAATYDTKYAALRATELIPVSTEAGPGAQKIIYRSYDAVGMAKIIADYADDLPRSDVKGIEYSANIRSLGSAYGYNINEIRAAMMAGVPLEQRKANAARRAIDQLVNSIAFNGDSAYGLYGLLNNPNITTGTVASDGSGTPATLWSGKTPDQIIRDFNAAVAAMRVLTKDVEMPDTALFSIANYNYIASTPRATVAETTILQWLQRSNPGITRWEAVIELTGVGAGGTSDGFVLYRRDPDHLTLEIPQPFEQFPPQARNLEFVVDCHARIGGVIVYYPLSVTLMKGT
jgi:hypothetical protein